MATTIPGGVYLDSRGRPQDANGNRLEGLPDTLSEEEKEACREAGLVAEKQVVHFDAATLTTRFGISEEVARKAKGEQDLFESGGDEASDIEATDAARTLAEKEGLDLSKVEGTGKNGKVTKPDVEAALSDDNA